MKLNDDGTLSILGAALTTAEVDRLLHEAAKLRSQMQPEVPKKAQPDTILLPQEAPTFFVGKASDGGVSVSFRHAGFGWCTFVLPPGHAAQLAAFIRKRTVGEHVGFVEDQIPDPDASKH